MIPNLCGHYQCFEVVPEDDALKLKSNESADAVCPAWPVGVWLRLASLAS